MRYAITFENWDEDAIEAGETDDRGYSVEWTDCTWSDIWDLKSDWTGAEFSGKWFTKSETDFRTGDVENESLHFENVDLEIVQAIFSGKINRNALNWATTLQEVRECAKAFDASEVIERLEELLEEAETSLNAGIVVPCTSIMDEIRVEAML